MIKVLGIISQSCFFMRDIYEAVLTSDAADSLQNKFFVVI